MEDKNLGQKIELEFAYINFSDGEDYCIMLLREKDVPRAISLTVSNAEAQMVALALEKPKEKTPLIHSLLANMLSYYEIEVKEVIIYRFYEGIFYTTLNCQRGEDEMKFEARLTDAMVFALQLNIPIYTYETLMQEVAFSTDTQLHTDDMAFQLDQLEMQLDDAIEKEDYVRAARLRDDIKKLQNQ